MDLRLAMRIEDLFLEFLVETTKGPLGKMESKFKVFK
jgi:hypothetical protein